eukprot:TRINITY_DN497_c0_g1_i1.p1 TRINITY_DN497_c0_g1~~TRINITY_DN497_c0_g1_i1.p1  ORF type:complete len:158 (-),score=40.01 TRINITY_DN497_c0_g1_i1:72-545(-)
MAKVFETQIATGSFSLDGDISALVIENTSGNDICILSTDLFASKFNVLGEDSSSSEPENDEFSLGNFIQKINYIGPMFKLPVPTLENGSYIEIKAGCTHTVDFNIKMNFAVNNGFSYQIYYNNAIHYLENSLDEADENKILTFNLKTKPVLYNPVAN